MMAANGANTRLRVLGLDPAAAGPTGYGIIESDGARCRMLHYGALRVAEIVKKQSAGAALQKIHELVCALIAEFEPDVMAVESVFAALNVKTALRLAEVRGVVLLAAAQHGMAVHSYAPREIKASIAGYGHADKQQMQWMIRELLGLSETPEPADAADALAVAMCHVQAERMRRRFNLPDGKALRPANAARLRIPGASGATRAELPRISRAR